ncbi:hypothetical protein ABFS83_01G057400 [Erythranthe nasuta]
MGDSPPSLHRPPALSSPTAPPQNSPSAHHGRDVNKEEGNSQMAVRKFDRVYVRRCKKKTNSTNIESLPDELIVDILLHLSAQDIYDSAMFVCRKWYDMIRTRTFIYGHLRSSTPGLAIQSFDDYNRALFMSIGRGGIEVSKFGCNFKWAFWSSCNGLVLQFRDTLDSDSCFVANPITKRNFPLSVSLCPKVQLYRYSIAYAAASMVYKVVHTFPYEQEEDVEVQKCGILTVGVDKLWRSGCTEHLSPINRELLKEVPLTTEGFIHWTRPTGNHILTLNVETEVITEIPFPQGYGERLFKYCLSTGSALTFLTHGSGFSWEVWELKTENGLEWTRVNKIDLEAQKGKFVNLGCECPDEDRPSTGPLILVPVGWLNDGEVLVLHVSDPTRVCILYNLRTRGIDFFELEDYCHNQLFEFHRNSLVSVDGC